MPPGLHAGGNGVLGPRVGGARVARARGPARDGDARDRRRAHRRSSFAAGGADHEAVTPAAGRGGRASARRRTARGIDASRFASGIGLSHEVLPRARAAPARPRARRRRARLPVPDARLVARRAAGEGRRTMLLDDAYMPPVARSSTHSAPSRLELDELRAPHRRGAQGRRHAAVVRLGGQAHGGRMSFATSRRARAPSPSARHRIFSTRAGLALVAQVRRRSALRWKRTG